MEATMTMGRSLSISEVRIINDCLRSIELSLIWFGTRHHSWTDLHGFFLAEGKGIIGRALTLVGPFPQGPEPHEARRQSNWGATIKRLVFQLTGVYPGRAFVDGDLLNEIHSCCRDAVDRLVLSETCNEPLLVELKQRAAALHGRMAKVAPISSPSATLSFFGQEDYGKIKTA
jgi:hypothetical protein